LPAGGGILSDRDNSGNTDIVAQGQWCANNSGELSQEPAIPGPAAFDDLARIGDGGFGVQQLGKPSLDRRRQARPGGLAQERAEAHILQQRRYLMIGATFCEYRHNHDPFYSYFC